MPRRKLPPDPQLLKDFLEHPDWPTPRFADLYGVGVRTVDHKRLALSATRALLRTRLPTNQVRGAAALTDEEFADQLEACQFDRFAGRLP